MGISLDQLNAEADKRFAPFVVDDVPGGSVTLRNALRLPKADRDRLRKLQKDVNKLKLATDADESGDSSAAEEAVVGMLQKMFGILAAEAGGGDRLSEAVGDDPAKLMLIMEMYAEDTQLGEALRSAS